MLKDGAIKVHRGSRAYALSVIVGTHDIQLECDVNPAIAKGIRQYYKTNSNAQVSNELFVSQLMTLGLREVASHVNNALRSINDDCKLTSLSTFPGLTKKN